MSLAQSLLGAPSAGADEASLEVRAKALGGGSGVRLSITAVTGATPPDLQALVARLERRLALTCGPCPRIDLHQEGTRRLTIRTILFDQGGTGP